MSSNIELRLTPGESPVPLSDVTPEAVFDAPPARKLRNYKGRWSTPATYWFEKTAEHLRVDSKLERTRLMLADFDRSTVRAKPQPFQIISTIDGKKVTHIPDFFFAFAGTPGSYGVCNVRHPGGVASPPFVRAVRLVQDLGALMGWTEEVWTGEMLDRTFFRNVRGLLAFRNPEVIPPAALSAALAMQPATLKDIGEHPVAGVEPEYVRGAVMHLLWHQRWTIDYSAQFTGSTPLDHTPDKRRVAQGHQGARR